MTPNCGGSRSPSCEEQSRMCKDWTPSTCLDHFYIFKLVTEWLDKGNPRILNGLCCELFSYLNGGNNTFQSMSHRGYSAHWNTIFGKLIMRSLKYHSFIPGIGGSDLMASKCSSVNL